MRAIDRLRLGCGVPPRVHQEHVVGFGESETEAARLEADEEHRRIAPAERVDHIGSPPGRSVEVFVPDAVRVEVGPHQVEVRRELAEDEGAVPFGDEFAQPLAQRVELRRRDAGVTGIHQSRRQCQHAQEGQ